jgi:fimbrial chaperone protein
MHRFLKLKRIDNHFKWLFLFCFSLILMRPAFTHAGTFAVRISPPNFEIKAKPGEIVRNIITIENTDVETGVYNIRTADWDFNENGGVVIHPPDKSLQAGSCRPWTRLERTRLEVASNRTKRYRFEVHVPEDVKDGACKFAITISPAPETVDALKMGNLDMPILGSIAIIVYVTVGNAQPDVFLEGVKKIYQDGEPVPLLSLHNNGNAHARPFGSVTAKDSKGKTADLLVAPLPILPGESMDIQLTVDPRRSGIEKMSELTFPISVKGLIEWDGGTTKIDSIIE